VWRWDADSIRVSCVWHPDFLDCPWLSVLAMTPEIVGLFIAGLSIWLEFDSSSALILNHIDERENHAISNR
jgi:hypothetical protein